MAKKSSPKKSTGTLKGFLIGFIFGVVLTGVVTYLIIQMPVPFVNKAPQAAVQPTAGNTLPDPNTPLVNRPSAPTEPSVEPTKPAVVTGTTSSGENPTTATTTPAADGAVYYLQVGAYRATSQADEMSTRLIFLGYVPQIQNGESGGSVIHRVRLGPYETRAAVDAVRAQLSLQGMDASVIKLAP